MSTHIRHAEPLAIEIGTADLTEAAENYHANIGDLPDRALELLTDEETAVVSDEDGDGEGTSHEIETAEEVSLKNGVYQEIKRKLCERFGISPAEIAFAHDADTPAKKAALYKAVNAGKVRVLIGSTGKLGTGVNVQKRLVALHHVDEPWKPAELEQREGRILRQGNIYPEAFIFHYVTERSFDGYMLQTLESKARFISQIMAGEVTARTAEDVGDMVLTVAQVKAIASGNPLVQKRIELEVKLVKLDRLRAAYYNNRAAMRADLEHLPQEIVAHEAELHGHEQAISARQTLADDAYRITLKRTLGDSQDEIVFDKRERAGAHLRHLADLLMDRVRRGSSGMSMTEEVGMYRGFGVSVHVSGNSRLAHHSTLFNYNSEIHLRAASSGECGAIYVAQIGESNVGITQSVDYQLRHLEDRLEQTRAGVAMLQSRLDAVQAEVDKPWAHAAEYRRLRKRYETMGAALHAEGIEVESNTTFTAEEGEDAPDDACDAGAGESIPVDEVGARRNPYTGLEDFPLIAEEVGTDADYSDELGGGAVQDATLDLFSSGAGVGTDTNEAHEQADIFSAAPSDDAADEDEESPTLEDGDELSADEMSDHTFAPRPTVFKNAASPKSKRKGATRAASDQGAFLWN